MSTPRQGRLATLWNMTWSDPGAPTPTATTVVSCVVYQGANGMELRLESETGTILSEPFDMQPRSLSRTRALRESLKRRGWKEQSSRIQDPSSKSQ
jgi:hypothetical protein